MADLVITDPTTQTDVLATRLPYRSVEIFNVEQPSIDSLALLDHEAPYLPLPMLLVSDVDGQNTDSKHALGGVASATFRSGWQMDARKDSGPMVACFRHGDHAHLLFHESEETMSTNQETLAADASAEDITAKFADNGYKPEEKAEKDEDKSEDMENGAYDVSAVVSAIESGEISVSDMDAILAAIQGAQTEEAPEEEGFASPN